MFIKDSVIINGIYENQLTLVGNASYSGFFYLDVVSQGVSAASGTLIIQGLTIANLIFFFFPDFLFLQYILNKIHRFI